MIPFGTDGEIDRVVEEYSPLLLHLAASRLASPADAEDAVQEVFLRLLTAAPVFRDAGHEKAWLIRATLQRSCDIRREAERKNLPLEEAAQTAGAQTTKTQTDGGPDERFRELRNAVRALPEKYAAVIHLYYYEGYSIKEIGKLLGLPAPTVGTRLARGRERLRQMLKEDD